MEVMNETNAAYRRLVELYFSAAVQQSLLPESMLMASILPVELHSI